MQLIHIRSTYQYGTVLALLALTACGWVDSTGNQIEAPPALIDSSVVLLEDGEPLSINENTQRTVAFKSTDSLLKNWRWKLLEGQANIRHCTRFADFELTNASNSLSQSCASTGSCEVNLVEETANNETQFRITAPLMRAPAALEFQLTARDRNGQTVLRRQLLCAIPINEAPDAVDDQLSVTRGTYLSVSGSDEQSLLANDDDDEDVRNLDLSINTTPVEGPLFAANFQLFSDGGFIYEPQPNAPLSKDGSVSDQFVYAVTDGSNTNTATVSIKITAFNNPPILLSELPDIQTLITDPDVDTTLFNLKYYFSDADLDTLSFSTRDNALPASGNIYLTNDGLLRGRPSEQDSGRYFVALSASDSIDSVDANFYLNVVRRDGSNRAPYADDITNKTVQDQFSYDVSGFFGDPDQDHLSFTTTGTPAGVELSPDGVLYGASAANNRGRWFIRVIANDGNGGTTSDGFLLRIR